MFWKSIFFFFGQEYMLIINVGMVIFTFIGLLLAIFAIKKRKMLKISLICITSFICAFCLFGAVCNIIYKTSDDSKEDNPSSESTSDGFSSSSSTSSSISSSSLPPEIDLVPMLYAKPSSETDKWGYVDGNGKVVIPYTYDLADDFIDGYAAVCQDNKWGFIDLNGKEVIPFKYNFAWSFIDGLAPVLDDKKWGFIDKNGNVKISFKFTKISRRYEGHELVYLDENGDIINYEKETSNDGSNSKPSESSKPSADSSTTLLSNSVEMKDNLKSDVDASIYKSELQIAINKSRVDGMNDNSSQPFRWGIRLESNKENKYAIELEVSVNPDGSIVETNASANSIIGTNEYRLIQDNITKVFANSDSDKYILSCNIANSYIPVDDICITTLIHYTDKEN